MDLSAGRRGKPLRGRSVWGGVGGGWCWCEGWKGVGRGGVWKGVGGRGDLRVGESGRRKREESVCLSTCEKVIVWHVIH